MKLFSLTKPYHFAIPLNKIASNPQSINIIIIGGGMTGLCLAALLIKAGYKITILEANPEKIGGHARIITFDDVTFSVGPQYLWSFGDNSIGQNVLKYLGLNDKITFESMLKSGFEVLFNGKSKVGTSIPMGFPAFEAKLIDLFPEEKNGLNKFFSIMCHVFTSARYLNENGYYLMSYKEMQSAIILTSKLSLKTKFITRKFSKWSLKKMFDYCKLSQEVRRIFTAHAGIFCETESTLSYAIYVAATGNYHDGAFLPKFGFKHFQSEITSLITDGSSQILLNKTVEKIETQSGKVVSVTCIDQSNYKADLVVSTISPRQTAVLLGEREDHYTYQPSNSLLTACFVLKDAKEITEQIKYRNFWWQADKIEPDLFSRTESTPFSYLFTCSNLCDLTEKQRLDGTLGLIAFAPYSFEQSKNDASETKENYEQRKNELANEMLNIIETKFFPGIRKHVVSFQTITPWDIFKDVKAENGNVYGRRLTFQSIKSQVPQFTKIQNIYLASATIGVPGIAVAFKTAALLFNKLTGIEIKGS